jgi:hypothetical protein
MLENSRLDLKQTIALIPNTQTSKKLKKAQKPKWLKRLLRRVRDRFFLRKNPYPKGLARHSLGSSRYVQMAKRLKGLTSTY